MNEKINVGRFSIKKVDLMTLPELHGLFVPNDRNWVVLHSDKHMIGNPVTESEAQFLLQWLNSVNEDVLYEDIDFFKRQGS